MTDGAVRRVWYVAYGSNLALRRFRRYLRGGPVPGGARVYDGCRDPRDPADTMRLDVRGGLVFAGRSTVWGGGMAFYDPRGTGRVACRAYLLTSGQLADVVAQEMRQPPGGPCARDVEARLSEVDTPARGPGPGLYDTVIRLGDCDGVPVFTVTHGEVASMAPVAPTAPYLRWIVAGLEETHGWDPGRAGRYLADAPGVRADWTPEAIAALSVGGRR